MLFCNVPINVFNRRSKQLLFGLVVNGQKVSCLVGATLLKRLDFWSPMIQFDLKLTYLIVNALQEPF